jgi:4-amino-4-deoxy-L-arabinose transferase-like glycosyltransferase
VREINTFCPLSLCLLLLVVLAVRFAVLSGVHDSHPSRALAQDSKAYDRLALSVLHRGAFASSNNGVETPEVLRTPGYPVFIAAIYAAFGEDKFRVLAVQVILSVLTLVPLYWIGAMIWSQEAGLVAALLYSLDYISLLASQMLLTDSLYVFALVSALSLGVAAMLVERRTSVLLVLFGLTLALTTLIRPVSYYLIVPVLVGFACVYGYRSGWKRALRTASLIFLPWLLVVGGWQVRNQVVADTLQVSLIQGTNLMRYRGAYIIAQRDGLDLLEARKVFQNEVPDLQSMTAVEKNAAFTGKTLQLMREHPKFALSGQIEGTAQLLLVPGEAEVLRYLGFEAPYSGVAGDLLRLDRHEFTQKWLVDNPAYLIMFLLALAYLFVLYAGSGVAVVKLIRKGGAHLSAEIFLIGVALYFIIVSGGPEGYPRLRMPVTPILALFAAAGWLHLLQRRKSDIRE